jgi:hypothetical protein
MSALRAIGPVLFTTIFAVGVKEQILWGGLIWVPLVTLGVVLRVTLMDRWVPDNVRRRDEVVMSKDVTDGPAEVETQGRRAEEDEGLLADGQSERRTYGATENGGRAHESTGNGRS